MTRLEQIELLNKINDAVCGIFDGIADECDEDSEMFQSIVEVEQDLHILMASLAEGEIDESINYFDHEIPNDFGDPNCQTHKYSRFGAEVMMRKVCQIIAFSDCTDERVTKIVYRGREIEYIGWQPGMKYEFADSNGIIRYSASFPEWDH